MTNRQYFFRVFRYLKPYKYAYCIGALLYSSQLFLFPLVNSIFFGGIMAAILDFSFASVVDAIWVMVAMLFGVVVLSGIGAYLYAVNTAYGIRDISKDIFDSFMKSTVEDNKHSGEGVAALNTDVNTASGIFGNEFIAFLQNFLAAVFSIVAVIVIDYRMGIGALAVGLIVFFVQSRFAKPLAQLGKAQLESTVESVKSVSNIIAGALTIRAYNWQDNVLIQFDRGNGRLKELAFKQAFIGMWQDLFNTVQGWLTLVYVFALGGYLVIAGEIDFATVMMVLPLASAISGAMSRIGATFAGLQPPIVAAKRIFAIIDSVSNAAKVPNSNKWSTGLQTNPTKAACASTSGHNINISDLSFSYKGAISETIKDISLSIGENEMIAFVGESGSGKSTLLRVIVGMYERGDVNMEIGGLPFTAENIDEWRNCFAYVDQDSKLFDMSIKDNIAMGRRGRASDADIHEAARLANAHDFITEMPAGYSTSCGEKGASLSGGQKQRIAIARALCKKAPVLVFDEATSALEMESECDIMKTIEGFRRSHTILIITHNLRSIATADKIVVMDKGCIAESGTHEELLARGGMYTNLLNCSEM